MFGLQAVAIFGGFIDPLVTSYDFHNNIYVDIDGSSCCSRGYVNIVRTVKKNRFI